MLVSQKESFHSNLKSKIVHSKYIFIRSKQTRLKKECYFIRQDNIIVNKTIIFKYRTRQIKVYISFTKIQETKYKNYQDDLKKIIYHYIFTN